MIKEEIEKELLANISESSLEVIIAEQYGDKIEWEKNNKEFSLEGEMYDVARIKVKKGKTFLYCINDKKEKQLLKELAKAANGNHNSKNPNNNLKSPLTDIVCMNCEEDVSIFSGPSIYSTCVVSLVSSFEETLMPPPKA